MYKIGLKLWSTNTGAYYTEAQKLYSQGFFDYIELYVLPDSLDHLQKWKALKIPYIIHCPHSAHGFNLANKTLEDSNRRIYEQTKQYADELDAQYIIFHGGCDGSIEETARQLANFKEPRALLENKPQKPLPSTSEEQQCRGYSLEELQMIIHTTGCGFCLDIGHAVCAANSMKKEPYQYVRELFLLSPKVVHLSDISDMKSEYDSHPNLGTGMLDIPQIMDTLPKTVFITIETNKPDSKSLTRFKEESSLLCRLIA